MKNSIEYLQQLIANLGNDWKQELDAYLKNEDSMLKDENESYFLEFSNACKEEIIENKASNMQKIEKIIDNDLLFKNLQSYFDNLLTPYYASSPLRILEIKNVEAASHVIDKVFEQAILRYNPDISSKYLDFGFENQDTFIDFLNVIDSMCTFVITKNLYSTSINELIYSNTRLSKKLCKHMTNLIDKNFEQLKTKLILEKLYQ